ncbi:MULTISPECIES: tripartite tricarboxylate transporter substrate binding protein [Cupriavidus]|uniref:tripartite tricarboxylate transporter substrate binding protein n=1 Tax=Cupriavidus TaxID=106589 RepID=UPI0009BCC674|nr:MULTISPECIES: tripartite tricarboxylate transporter substrate binding protein [Cupriavidus]
MTTPETTSMMLQRTRAVAVALLCALGATIAAAQPDTKLLPAKPVRIIVPFSAGALTDIIARIYAEKLTPRLGQPVLVENRPGAGGVVASQMVLKAPADGSSILFVSSAHAVNPALQNNLPYDTLHDFSGLALLASSPSVIVVNANHPAKTLPQFIAMAKRKPESMSYGSAGVGAATHLAGEYFNQEAGIKMLHVPYKGVQEAVAEVVGGRLDAAFPPVALALPFTRSGQLRALAVTSSERSPMLPDVPTVQELGIARFDYSIWYALVMSSKAPKPVMEMLAGEMRAVSDLPDVREKLLSQGLVTQQLTLADFDRFIKADIKKMDRIVKSSGAKVE